MVLVLFKFHCCKQYYMAFYQKEITAEEQAKPETGISQLLENVQKVGFVAACGLYCLSTLFTLPLFNQENSQLLLARQLLFNFTIALAISESCQIASRIKTLTKLEVINYLITLGGCLLLGSTSLYQKTYNQGAKYMISSFLLSVSNEFKIISLLLPQNRLKEQRNRFLCQISCCVSSIIFFFGAAIKQTGLQAAYALQICPTINLLSGVLMSFSIFYILRPKEDKCNEGYQGIGSLCEAQ